MNDIDLAHDLRRRGGWTSGGETNSGTPLWFARNFGVSHTTVARWGDEWPTSARTVLILLDRLDVSLWPEGWRKPPE